MTKQPQRHEIGRNAVRYRVPWIFRSWRFFLLYTATLTMLCLMPDEPFPEVSEPWLQVDKIGHFTLFGFQAFLIVELLARAGARQWSVGASAVALVVAFGAFIEHMQSLLPGGIRTFSMADLFANALGAAVFAFLAVYRYKSPKEREEKG